MKSSELDQRSQMRRVQDELIAAEPILEPLDLPSDAPTLPVEAYLRPQRRRPMAVAGVVENGLVRPLDPLVKLAEHSQVIIVATEIP